jgi:hypothetical protein
VPYRHQLDELDASALKQQAQLFCSEGPTLRSRVESPAPAEHSKKQLTWLRIWR